MTYGEPPAPQSWNSGDVWVGNFSVPQSGCTNPRVGEYWGAEDRTVDLQAGAFRFCGPVAISPDRHNP